MSKYERNSLVFTEPGSTDFPPWTDAQRDAQIQALRDAFCMLAADLATRGVLPIEQVLEAVGRAIPLDKDSYPDRAAAALWLADTIDYIAAKRQSLRPKARRRAAAPRAG